jgi:hypothetical protein
MTGGAHLTAGEAGLGLISLRIRRLPVLRPSPGRLRRDSSHKQVLTPVTQRAELSPKSFLFSPTPP